MKKTIPKKYLTKAFLQDYADQQIAKYLAVGPVDEELAESHLAQAYKVAKLSPPKEYIWFDSPVAFSKTASVGDSVRASVGDSVWASVGDSVGASVRASVWDSVWASVWASVGDSVGASVWDSVWASVGASVGDSVWDSVWASVWASVGDSVWASVWASVGDSVRASVWDSVGAWDNSSYDSWLKYFNDQMEENDFRHICLFDEMVNGYLLTAETAYIVRKPIFLSRDEQGRLHNDQRSAIEWADGFKIYYLHGTEFDEKLFNKVTSPKLDIKDVLKITNSDQRTEAWRILSPDKFLKGARAKLLNTGQKGTKLYEVPNFMETGETEYCIVMQDTSTDRVFLEWVEPKIGKHGDAELCQAEAFGIPLEDWLAMPVGSEA